MVGRRPSSYTVGLQKFVYLPIFLLRYMPIIPEGAKRTFHDGEKLHRLTNMTLSHGIKIYEEDFPKWKEKLEKMGYEKIVGEQMTVPFPAHCPRCLKMDGNPHLRLIEKTISNRYDYNFGKYRIEKMRFRLYYQHNKPKSQCHIGYLDPILGKLELTKEIGDIRRISPFYSLREGESRIFDLPKKKRSKPKKLK